MILIFFLSNVHWTLFNLICKWLSENLLLQSACYFVPKEVKSRTDTNQIPWRSQWMGGAIISYLAAWPTGQIVSRFFCSHSPLEIGQRGGRGPYQRSEGAFRRVNWTVIIFVVDIETEALHIFRLMCDEDEKLNYVCRPGKFVLPILKRIFGETTTNHSNPSPLVSGNYVPNCPEIHDQNFPFLIQKICNKIFIRSPFLMPILLHTTISVSFGVIAFLYLLFTDYYWFILMGHQNGLLSQTSCGLFMVHLYCPLV